MSRKEGQHGIYGTGFVVAKLGNEMLVLTNHHFARNDRTRSVTDRTATVSHLVVSGERARWNAKLVASDEDWDLALYSVNANDPKVGIAVLDECFPGAGVEVESMGFPLERTGVKNPVQYQALARSRGVNMDSGLIGRQPVQGESGSPVFRNGKVVGIIYGYDEEHGRCTPVELIRSFLSDAADQLVAAHPALVYFHKGLSNVAPNPVAQSR